MKNKRRKQRLRIGAAVILLAGVLLWYGFYIEPDLLAVRHYTLEASPDSTADDKTDPAKSVRVVQISDLQLGEHYSARQLQKVVRKIQKEVPDVIVFTGDLFEEYKVCGADMEPEVTACLRQLQAPLGKYAVWGNRDYGGGAEKAYRRVMKEAGFTLLRNDRAELSLESGQKILLCGLDDSLFGKPDGTAFFQHDTDTYVYRILLLHEPDVAQLWSHSSFQLILAGHSHGGQVRLPFCPGFQTTLARHYMRHFYTLNEETGLKLYVNTGLGTSHMRFRLGVPPEVAVFDIRTR